MQKPKPTAGMRHIALHCEKLKECVHFYTELLGMKVIWQPDDDNYYLTSGHDNVALHRAPADFLPAKHQHLDHLGFFLTEKADVDVWYEYLLHHKADIKAKPKDHRDGTRSLYVADPDGNVVQLIYYPMDK